METTCDEQSCGRDEWGFALRDFRLIGFFVKAGELPACDSFCQQLVCSLATAVGASAGFQAWLGFVPEAAGRVLRALTSRREWEACGRAREAPCCPLPGRQRRVRFRLCPGIRRGWEAHQRSRGRRRCGYGAGRR